MIQEIGLIGKKIGMTREFYKSGQSVPVTAVKIDKGRIIQLISKDQRGYNAVQVGFGKIKNSKLSKQMKGFFSRHFYLPFFAPYLDLCCFLPVTP